MTVYKKVESDKGILTVMYDQDGFDPRGNDNLGTMVCSHRRYNLGDEQASNIDHYDSWKAWAEGEIGNFDEYIILPLYLYDHSGITMNTTGFHCRWDSGQVGWIYCSKERFLQETGYTAKALFGTNPKDTLEVGDYVNVEGVEQVHFGKVESIEGDTVKVDWTYLYSKERHSDPSLKGVYPKSKVSLVTGYAKTMLRNEVEEYDHYLRGDVYGYKLEKKEVIEGCVSCGRDEEIELVEVDSCWGFFGSDFEANGMKGEIPKEFAHLVEQL